MEEFKGSLNVPEDKVVFSRNGATNRQITNRWWRVVEGRDGESGLLYTPSLEIEYNPSQWVYVVLRNNFIHDFASTPPFMHRLLPPDGPWKWAAVFHDFVGYTHRVTTTVPMKITRKQGDDLFLSMMRDCKVRPHIRLFMYTCVRVGGRAVWREKGREYEMLGLPLYPNRLPIYPTKVFEIGR